MPATASKSIAEDTATVTSILPWFLRQARRTPYADAIRFEDQTLNFAELDALANRFAGALTAAGVGRGQTVGLCLDRRPEAVAAMLGVFKVGAVFVPLDPEYPLDRLQFMIEDAGIRAIVIHNQAINQLASSLDLELDVTWIDSATREFEEFATDDSVADSAQEPLGSDLAYIMYTSGSTGKPKGVQIDQLALTTYCRADIQVYGLTPQDRTLQFSTLNFDIAIEEIFPPLLSGGCVVIRPSERSDQANELSAIVKRYDISAVHLATAYWHEWVDLMVASGARVPESLRLVIATGEKVSVEHYRRWQSICDHDVLWCNAYGPTEATVTSTVFIPPHDFSGANMPIGQALPGYECFILSDEYELLSEGTTGQLFVAGPALARGYLNRPELTEKAFIEIDLPGHGHLRLYRTGDLARWLPDGNIEFAGRVDHQIKLGSYRIEPGEIEAVLSKHPQVLDSLVVHEKVDEQKHLIAYVATGMETPSVAGLAEHLSGLLPVYMVPPRYVLMESFPKTINGKIDRAALPSPASSVTAANASYVAPRTDLERKLAEIWVRVLNLPQIGIHDDFFALGGSSLLVARVVTALTRELSIQLPVRDFFANPTIASSARHLARLLGQDVADDSARAERRQNRERLPIVEPAFVGPASRSMFCVRYRPRDSWECHPSASAHAIILCNSYGHEHTRGYRNLQQLALQLCGLGFEVFRFDYLGTGNSSGSCRSCRVETFQENTRYIAAHARRVSRCERLSSIGLRLGATVAATAEIPSLDSLLLWDPVVDGQKMLADLEHMHDFALQSQTRFPRRTSGEAGQLYGHATDEAKLESFGRIRLPATCGLRNLVLTSKAYADLEPGLHDFAKGWNLSETSDEIFWHNPRYAECAFASPDATRQIVQFLTSGERA